MMVAVGMLAMFALLLASFQNFDALLFESGLRYETRELSDRPPADDGGVVLTVTQGVQVMSAVRFDDPERWRGDFNDSVTPVVWSHSDASGERLRGVLDTTVVAGRATGSRVLVDEATAAQLGVGPGDGIVLTSWDDDLCRLTVGGVTRTYREIGGSFLGGLLIVPAAACEEGVTAWTDDNTQFLNFDGSSPSAQTWLERMGTVALSSMDFQASGLFPAVLVISLGLWFLASLRATRRIRDSLALPSDLLFDLGCTAGHVRTTHLLVSGVLVTGAAIGAAWGAHEALWRVAEFYTQPAHWVSVALVFAAATMTVLFVAHRRASREASRRPTPPTASTPTSDKGNS